MDIIRCFIMLGATLFMSLSGILALADDRGFNDVTVKLKVLVANPQSAVDDAVSVNMPLPQGIKPEDIVDIGDFGLGYDEEKRSYYVYQQLDIPPGGSKMMQIEIKDIWRIGEEKLGFLQSHTQKLHTMLKQTDYAQASDKLSAAVFADIEEIRQDERAASDWNVAKRMERYQFNLQKMDDIRDDIGSLENLVIASGGTLGQRVQEETIGVISLEEDRMASSPYPDGIITLKIKMTNPGKNPQRLHLKYHVFREMRPEYVIDRAGLELGYDFDKGAPYFYADIDLDPNEIKTWEVKIKDVWNIPGTIITGLKQHTQKSLFALKGTDYYEQGEFLSRNIYKWLDVIVQTQKKQGIGPDEHIAIYRANSDNLSRVKKAVAELEKLTLQAGLIPGVTVVAGRNTGGGEEGASHPGMDKDGKKEKDILGGINGLRFIARSLFGGKAPARAAVWKAIYAILIFLALVTSVFFVSQFSRNRQVMIDGLTGTFTREYIMERLGRELRVAQRMQRPCALLMVDIDKFKQYNDTYGSAAGDTILKEFVVTMRKIVRPTDLLGRIGGDDFMIILPADDKNRGREIARRLKDATHDNEVKIKNAPLRITASIGITAYPDDGESADDLISKADMAMYKAKARGGDAVDTI
ncbi:MAG: GGDEF domain-containing protein [Candidatus Omnitrophota bacterium]